LPAFVISCPALVWPSYRFAETLFCPSPNKSELKRVISARREWRKAARTLRRVDTSRRRLTDALIDQRHRLAEAAQLKGLRAIAKNCELSLEYHNVLRSMSV
jgi:hypothetical protein